VRAGVLNRRLTIRVPSDQSDGSAEPTFVDGDEVWASIEPLSGRELFDAQTTRTEQVVRIRMRWRSDLTQKHQLRRGTVDYDIEAIMSAGERGRELEIIAVRHG